MLSNPHPFPHFTWTWMILHFSVITLFMLTFWTHFCWLTLSPGKWPVHALDLQLTALNDLLMTSQGWSVLVLVFFPRCSKVLHLEILGAWSECLFQMERFLRTVMSSIFQYFWCRSRILHMALLLGLYPMLNLECGWNTENMIEMWIGSEKASHALDQAQEYSTIYLNDGSFY
jgi:hypothetical protein